MRQRRGVPYLLFLFPTLLFPLIFWMTGTTASFAISHQLVCTSFSLGGPPKKTPDAAASRQEIADLLRMLGGNLMPCRGLRDQMRSFWALQAIDGGRAAVPLLVEVLREGPNTTAGAFADDYLGELGASSASAVPELAALLKAFNDRKDDEWRGVPPSYLCHVLGAVGARAEPAVPILRGTLVDRDPWAQAAAAMALLQIGHADSIVQKRLQWLLESKHTAMRAHAVRVCSSRRSSDGSPILKSKIEMMLLEDPSAEVRIEAARGLLRVGNDQSRIVSTVARILKDGRLPPSERDVAVLVLGELGPKALDAIPQLRSLPVREMADSERINLLLALARIQGPSSEMIRQIFDLLERSPRLVSYPCVARTLWNLGDPLREEVFKSILRLIKRKEDGGISTARSVFAVISELGGKAAILVRPLMDELRGDDPFQRQFAARALGLIGQSAREAIAALRDLTKDEDPCVRVQALDAIRRILS